MSEGPALNRLQRTLQSRTLLSRVVLSFGMRSSGAGLTFVTGLVCAQALQGSASAYGEYSLAISWINILVIVTKLGFDTASLRYLSQYRSQQEFALLRGFVQISRRLTLLAALLFAGGLIGVTWFFRAEMSPTAFACLMIAAPLLPVMGGIQLRESSLIAFGRVITGQVSSVLLPVLLISQVWLVPLATGHHLSSSDVVLLHLCSAGTALFVLSIVSRRTFTQFSANTPVERRTPEWLRVSTPLLFVQLLNLLQHQSGTVMCGALVDSQTAGLYSAVARISGVLFLGLHAINTIAAPTIASLYHAGKTAELERFVRKCASASFLFGASFSVLAIVGGRFVLGLFGEEFVEGYIPMVILVGGLAFASATGPVTHLLLMTDHQWDCIKVFAVNVAFCLTLGCFLIPRFGVLGAAATAAFARLSSATAVLLVARRRHGLWCLVGGPSVKPPEQSVLRRAA